MDAHRAQRRTLLSFLGLSVLLHLQAVMVVLIVFALNPDGCNSSVELPVAPIEVALVTPEERDEAQARLQSQEKEEEKRERDEKGQVVDLPAPLEEKRPADARYLSEYDSTVERETKGPPKPLRPGRVPRERKPSTAARSSTSTPRHAERQRSSQQRMQLAMRAVEERPRSELSPADHGTEAAQRNHGQQARAQTAGGARAAQPARPALDLAAPDIDLNEAVGARANDALTDVEEGETTLLNSKRWRFASFFNRVKRQVAQNWHPDRVYRRRDPAGNVYGFRDRLTILRVKLTPTGDLKALHVEQPSGLAFLDDEAVSAFQLAEPFPNPPKGLVDEKSGLISFRFGFLFELSRSTSFRIFRYGN